jgi:hypothetical protein
MSWTFLLVALGIVLLVAATLHVVVRWGAFARRGVPVRAASAASSGSSASHFGLAPQDAEQFRQSARSDMEREQMQWDRDYLPGVSDGAIPGRIAGIPRTLRVKR